MMEPRQKIRISRKFAPRLAVTVTLNPDVYKFDLNEQLERVVNMTRKHLEGEEYEFCAEVTAGLNVHLHGIMYDTPRAWKRLRRLKHEGRRVIGFTYIKRVKDLPGWKRYMYKEFEKTSNVLGGNPIVLPHYESEEDEKEALKQIKRMADIKIVDEDDDISDSDSD